MSYVKETRVIVLFAALVAAAFLVPTLLPPNAAATHSPANKVAASGSGLEVASTPLVEGSSSETFTLLAGTMKTSAPTDLLVQVTMECALWTDIVTVGNDDSSATASITVWVEMDGVAIPVESGDNGEVVFCNRAYRMHTVDFDDEDARIEQYLSTRASNAFNWVLMNAGSGDHVFEVKARVDAEVTGTGQAYGAVGKRTLVIEPVKMANHADA